MSKLVIVCEAAVAAGEYWNEDGELELDETDGDGVAVVDVELNESKQAAKLFFIYFFIFIISSNDKVIF